ncbi:reverse transcriptase domain-containing protein [Tanacetum coccineum]|uniref:Reverse transcriptase domain-containing protein n=1 Tax=Tanacetum coccineum TaxID=301880 RepID=A0ABQ5C7L1_9ASTR
MGGKVVEAEGESSSNSLRQQRKRLENELASVSDVPLSDVGLREHHHVGSSLRATAENKNVGLKDLLEFDQGEENLPEITGSMAIVRNSTIGNGGVEAKRPRNLMFVWAICDLGYGVFGYEFIELKESVESESFKSSTQHFSVNDFIVINIPEEDVEPKQIILDPDDQPKWENAKIVAPTFNSAIVQPNVDDNFVINSTHLKMIWENKFDGYLQSNPHDHIREFLAICNMFKYGETQSEVVKLLIFPFSLCDKAKIWFNKLNEESMTSWEQMRRAFINRFFPPSLFNRLLLEIRNFSQNVMDSQIISVNEELQDMHNKYQDLRDNHTSKNHKNDNTPMCERHKAIYIQSEGNKDQNSHDSHSHQSHHDLNDPEKSLTELNNDVKNDLEDFKRRIRSMRTVDWKLFAKTMVKPLVFYLRKSLKILTKNLNLKLILKN